MCVPRSGISKGGSSVYVTSTINILVIEELMSSIHAILNPSSLLKTIITERAKRRFLFTFKEKFWMDGQAKNGFDSRKGHLLE